jgi:hypothetical protein
LQHSVTTAENGSSLHERRKHTGQTETDIRVARQNTTLSALLNRHSKLVATTKRTANLVVKTCIFEAKKSVEALDMNAGAVLFKRRSSSSRR